MNLHSRVLLIRLLLLSTRPMRVFDFDGLFRLRLRRFFIDRDEFSLHLLNTFTHFSSPFFSIVMGFFMVRWHWRVASSPSIVQHREEETLRLSLRNSYLRSFVEKKGNLRSSLRSIRLKTNDSPVLSWTPVLHLLFELIDRSGEEEEEEVWSSYLFNVEKQTNYLRNKAISQGC